jgi:GT2 family glycosyltransferase
VSAEDCYPLSLDIVIASKNREEDTRRCLLSIYAQRTQPARIIVVDQTEFAYVLPQASNLIHVHAPYLGGLAAARNHAVQYVGSDVALFLDDDMELLTDCVSALRAGFSQHPDAIGLVCLLSPLTGLTLMGRLREKLFEHGFFDRSPIQRAEGVQLRTLNGGGMCLRRTLLAAEKFDETLTGYSFGEDFEYAQRAKRYGKLWRCPQAQVYHHISSVNRLAAKTVRRDAWTNYLYFYDKLNAGAEGWNKLWLMLWVAEQSLLWLQAGMGLPPLSQSIRLLGRPKLLPGGSDHIEA